MNLVRRLAHGKERHAVPTSGVQYPSISGVDTDVSGAKRLVQWCVRRLACLPQEPAEKLLSIWLDELRAQNNCNPHTNGEAGLMAAAVNGWLKAPEAPRLVLDVGANVGAWTGRLLWECHKLGYHGDLIVRTFEPCGATHDVLQRNFAAFEHVVHHKLALGSTEGTALLYLITESSEENSLYSRRIDGTGLHNQGVEEIQVTTLDRFCDEAGISHVDLLKIDAQGHDLDVLRGAGGLLGRGALDLVQFEHASTALEARTILRDFFDLAASYRYRIGKLYPGGVRFYRSYDRRLESFEYSNWVLCTPAVAPSLASFR